MPRHRKYRYVLLGQSDDDEVKETDKAIAGFHVTDRALEAAIKKVRKTGEPAVAKGGLGAVRVYRINQ